MGKQPIVAVCGLFLAACQPPLPEGSGAGGSTFDPVPGDRATTGDDPGTSGGSTGVGSTGADEPGSTGEDTTGTAGGTAGDEPSLLDAFVPLPDTDRWQLDVFMDDDGSGELDLVEGIIIMGALSPDAGAEVRAAVHERVAHRLFVWMNRIYLREDDGSTGDDGLPISFFAYALETGSTPPPGESGLPRDHSYNRIELRNVGDMVSGTASSLGIDENNDLIENVGGITTPPDSYPRPAGVYVDHVSEARVGPWSTLEPPLSDDDLANVLDGSDAEVEQALDDIARLYAKSVAHEIAHSVGLHHNAGSPVMQVPTIGPEEILEDGFGFSYSDIQNLRTRLPGPGR